MPEVLRLGALLTSKVAPVCQIDPRVVRKDGASVRIEHIFPNIPAKNSAEGGIKKDHQLE
jgi:hypothetical protein